MPFYRIAGFVIDSPIELPNLSNSLASENQTTNITILVDTMPKLPCSKSERPFSDGYIQWLDEGFRLFHPIVGDMVILHQRIYWLPTHKPDVKGFRTFLVNTLLPAYAVLQKMLPMHISAVSVNGQAIAFQGNSGAGKSTLAAMLMKRGYPVITEDLGIVEVSESNPKLRAGLPYFRLWKKSLNQLAETPKEDNIAWLHQGKFYRSIENDDFCSQSQTIRAIYFLHEPQHGNDISITPIAGFVAANALFNSQFFGLSHSDPVQTGRIFNQTIALAKQTRCFNLTRPKDFTLADSVIDTLIKHWRDE